MADTLLLLSGRANTTPPAIADAAPGPLSLDRNSRLRTTALPDSSTTVAIARVTTASTNLVLIKAGNTNLLELTISNLTAAIIYVKLYDKATTPTASDVPRVTIPVPIGGFVAYEFGSLGKFFSLGLGLGVTGAAAATDATATAAGAQLHGTYN